MALYQKVIFPNLNGLRFLAAAVVIVNHIEMQKAEYGFSSIYHFGFVEKMGEMGVTLFFVLSGFLITYLLMVEKQEYGTINIRYFYFRRILRIWPLYYLLVILVLFVFPHIHFFQVSALSEQLSFSFGLKVALYFLMLPNLAQIMFPNIPFLPPTWSIGVEEQFYLLWPLLLKYCTRSLEMMVALVIIFFLLGHNLAGDLMIMINKMFHIATQKELRPIKSIINHFFIKLRIGSMAIGGIGAYLLLNKATQVLNFIFARRVQWFVYATLLIVFFRGNDDVPHEFYALLFLAIILNLAANESSIVTLSAPFFEYFGRISFGLYLLHMVVIYSVFEWIVNSTIEMNSIAGNFILYIASFSLTIALAAISYQFYERWFLKWKGDFTKIQSI